MDPLRLHAAGPGHVATVAVVLGGCCASSSADRPEASRRAFADARDRGFALYPCRDSRWQSTDLKSPAEDPPAESKGSPVRARSHRSVATGEGRLAAEQSPRERGEPKTLDYAWPLPSPAQATLAWSAYALGLGCVHLHPADRLLTGASGVTTEELSWTISMIAGKRLMWLETWQRRNG